MLQPWLPFSGFRHCGCRENGGCCGGGGQENSSVLQVPSPFLPAALHRGRSRPLRPDGRRSSLPLPMHSRYPHAVYAAERHLRCIPLYERYQHRPDGQQTARLDALGAGAHRTLDRLLLRGTERRTLLQLISDASCHQARIQDPGSAISTTFR